ncbi:MAG: hypothetical protein A2Y25_06450 [Candidatus Melainabacteria bacterium GWF2_37_15]|nr:MAG: hypothetical protein A2Y25_06450 [Candidatus Melainabacteria bacterium GWF2_37_15]
MSENIRENARLAYGLAYSSASKGYLGAILITDYKGFPLEFRYTDPIVPTKIQQVLYGEGLEKYLKIDVITDSLVKALSKDISVLFVQDEDLLEYKGKEIPIVRLSSTKMAPLSGPGDHQKLKSNELLLQTSHAQNPVRLLFKEDFKCEGPDFEAIIEKIIKAGNFMDVDEPLMRIQKTLELVCEQKL